MAMIAALSMYDFPETRQSNQNFWQLIRDELLKSGFNCPQNLSLNADILRVWQDPEMVFSQTCGLPYIQNLQKSVTLLGTPDYGLNPDNPGHYNSVIIVHKNNPNPDLAMMRDGVFAYNGAGSQSGVFAFLDLLFEQFGQDRFFSKCIISGGHANSVKMVAMGGADIASIDAVSWRYLSRFQGITNQVRVLTSTRSAPGLPYITAYSDSAPLIADAVERAIRLIDSVDRDLLGIQGFWRSTPQDYQVLADRAARVMPLFKKLGLGS